MTVSLNQLLAGIRQVESGGNYSVVNSIGAVGAYQVMKANIPSWTKKALGYSVSWQAFRNSKAIQDKVARVILGGYYSKYGAEGAASMWFSGQPNPGSSASDGGNTVYQYVAKVMAASGGGAIGNNGGAGSTYSVAAVTPKLDKYELAEQYGLTYAMIKGNRELTGLFNQAVKGEWDSTLFTAKLKNTRWWRTTSDPLRKYLLMKAGDPATWVQKTREANFAVNQIAVAVGFKNQLNGKNQASKLLQKAVYNKLALDWSDARLKSWFASQVGIDNGANSSVGGEVGEVFNQLHELAYNNGLRYTDWYGREARDVVAGKSTIQAAEGKIRREAAAKYGAFAEQIRAGQNVLDLAQPYIASVAQILELPATDIDLFNKYVGKAMSAKPNKDGSQYPLWQFETELRSDPLWRKTNNAREGMMSVARQVARDFGMAW